MQLVVLLSLNTVGKNKADLQVESKLLFLQFQEKLMCCKRMLAAVLRCIASVEFYLDTHF